MKVTELKGAPYQCTLADGSTLRLLPRETKEVAESIVSDELREGGNGGYVFIRNEYIKTPSEEKSEKESKKEVVKEEVVEEVVTKEQEYTPKKTTSKQHTKKKEVNE